MNNADGSSWSCTCHKVALLKAVEAEDWEKRHEKKDYDREIT